MKSHLESTLNEKTKSESLERWECQSAALIPASAVLCFQHALRQPEAPRVLLPVCAPVQAERHQPARADLHGGALQAEELFHLGQEDHQQGGQLQIEKRPEHQLCQLQVGLVDLCHGTSDLIFLPEMGF